MKKNNYGLIVNMSSGLGQISDMGKEFKAYRLSKVGLNALTRILAAETKGQNILVNTMCPGWVKTRMGGPHATRGASEGPIRPSGWLRWKMGARPPGQTFRDRAPIEW